MHNMFDARIIAALVITIDSDPQLLRAAIAFRGTSGDTVAMYIIHGCMNADYEATTIETHVYPLISTAQIYHQLQSCKQAIVHN